MKTTLNLDDELVLAAKRMALERGVTLTSVIEDALRNALTAPPRPEPYRLRWPTVEGRRAPDIDVSDRDLLFERMEDRR